MSEDRPVSIIVCAYNRAGLLPRIIGLLRDQDYPKDKYEIIIVDNGSTDNTKSIAESFIGQSEASVRYIFESRRGVTFARNRGSEVARNPYLAYIDDDCTVGPGWLQALMSGYNLDESIFAVFGQIINDWGEQIKPRWMMPATETWLGTNSFLGNSPKILENSFGTREANLSIKKEGLTTLGGFLGMEQFGSRDMAATELKYFLWKAKRMGKKIAYVPAATAHHLIVPRSRSWMIQRAYWQGISDGILEYIIFRRKWWTAVARACLDSAALIVLLGHVICYIILSDQPNWMFHLMRAVRRLGLILSELHLRGYWYRVDAWLRENTSR
jgi:glycosyltransferase involved in cell wall biosynthesis